MIELLVVMVIGGIVSTMLLGGWFALNRSFIFAVNSSNARDTARAGLSRMQVEIRDAQMPPYGFPTLGTQESAIYRARPYWIAIFTTFNVAGNNSASWTSGAAVATKPRLVVYRLYKDGKLMRFVDLNGNGVIDMAGGGSFDMSPVSDIPAGFNSAEETKGEGRTVVMTSVVNYTAKAGSPEPVFTYNSYDTSGKVVTATTVGGTDARIGIVAVQLHTLVDVNPLKAPVYADLVSTAQVRNQRQ